MNSDLRPESGLKYTSEETNEDGITSSPTSARKQQRTATFWDIFSLGIVLTIGGIHITWNRALVSGLAEIISAFVLVSIGFVCLILCSCEMTGLLPFSGGSYGFARVTLSPYIGFLVGCCDAFRCLVYVIRRTRLVGEILVTTFQISEDCSPLLWLIFFIPAIFIDSLGKRKFWGFITCLAIVSMTFTLLYLFVAAPQMNYDRYALISSQGSMTDSYANFALALPAVARMYQGIATIPLACEEARNPQTDVPRAMIATASTTFALGIIIIIASCSHAPGVLGLHDSDFPLSFGFAGGFDISLHIGPIFSFPAVYATCFGYAYSYGRILCAMARSGLLPTWISKVRGERDTPIVGIILGNFIMYVVMLALYFTKNSDISVSAAALIATVFVYWSVFTSFIILRLRFSNLNRVFKNPFGIPSAVLGILIFAILITAPLGFADYNWAAVVIFMSLIFIITAYYVLYAAQTQFYSQEEQSIMLVLYVMKANKMKRHKKKRKPSFVPYRSKSNMMSNEEKLQQQQYEERSATSFEQTVNEISNNEIQKPPARVHHYYNAGTGSNRKVIPTIADVAAGEDDNVSSNLGNIQPVLNQQPSNG